MSKGFLASVAGLLLGASWAAAQVAPVPAGDGVHLTPVASGGGFAAGMPDHKAEGLFWADMDYLQWWIKDSQTPPLVSAGAPATRAIPARGASVLFGGSDIHNEERMGGRFSVGRWL